MKKALSLSEVDVMVATSESVINIRAYHGRGVVSGYTAGYTAEAGGEGYWAGLV